MLILGIDTETTGLDTAKDKVIEVGLVLFDTELGQPVALESYLLNDGKGEPIPELITKLTGINSEMIEKYGVPPVRAFDSVARLLKLADYALAHNGNGFDRPIMINYAGSLGLDTSVMQNARWLDSKVDVIYPDTCRQNNMTYLQGYYKLVNPFAHRALTDILTTVTIIHNNFDWKNIITLANSPTVRLVADVPYEQRDLPKAAGFSWDSSLKIWFKDMKQVQIDAGLAKFNFRFRSVKL